MPMQCQQPNVHYNSDKKYFPLSPNIAVSGLLGGSELPSQQAMLPPSPPWTWKPIINLSNLRMHRFIASFFLLSLHGAYYSQFEANTECLPKPVLTPGSTWQKVENSLLVKCLASQVLPIFKEISFQKRPKSIVLVL